MKKNVTKKQYETFVRVLEKKVDLLIEKYKNRKKEDAQLYERKYLCGWDDGAITICEVIKDRIGNLKKGKYNY